MSKQFNIYSAQFPDITLLGQITLEQYNTYEHLIPEEIIRNRARHVMEEIDRVLQSITVLENNDLAAFGQLMIASHRSLQHLYEVTGMNWIVWSMQHFKLQVFLARV